MQASREMQEDMMGLSDDGYDDFNWDGEPVGIELEIIRNGGDDDAQ